MSDLVGNPEDRFSRIAAHIKGTVSDLISAHVCIIVGHSPLQECTHPL